MKYVEHSFGSAYIPKLLGLYEREIASVVEQAIDLKLERVVDIGAAEGYYAVGFALRCPAAIVSAFEADAHAREAITRMAKLNGVANRVSVHGFCDRTSLARALTTRTLVVCDCEGGELILLDPIRLPQLRRAWILVEVHDFCVPGTGTELRSRFERTHCIDQIWTDETRHRQEFPFVDHVVRLLPSSYVEWAVSDWRQERMYWLWMRPKADMSASELAGPAATLAVDT